jgi:NADPH2:quinone reductase
MRALRCNEYGPPECLVIEELPDPEPGPGEVVVKVRAAALNFPDALIVANRYQISVPAPFTPGSEFAGEIERVGEGVTGLAVGDRIMGSTFVGAFAERIALPARAVTLVPDGIDLQTAAAFGVVYLTAYHALRSVAEVKPGDWVAVLGAAGGVGLAAVELGRVLGARVLAAASSDAKLAACRAMGAEETINYETEDLKNAIKERTGSGADVVLDPVGGRYSEEALRATRFGGRFVTVGYATGEIPRIPLNLILLKGVIVKGFEIRTFGDHLPELAARDREEVRRLFHTGAVHPHLSAIYPLERAVDAFLELTERRAVGKVVIDFAA